MATAQVMTPVDPVYAPADTLMDAPVEPNCTAVDAGAVQLVEGVVVTKDELAAIMAVSSDWPFPAEEDGACSLVIIYSHPQ